jgi:protein SCO1/2
MTNARTVAALGLVLSALLALPLATRAAHGATSVPPQTEISQRLDAALPLELPFTDANGRLVRLGNYFADRRPVILVLGYYRCPNLCGLAMHGLLEALDASGLPRSDYRIVAVSIDPQETPADARDRGRVYTDYASFLRTGGTTQRPLDLQLLVGPEASIAALSERVGFAYERVGASSVAEQAPGDALAAASRYAHAAGIVVVTPDGHVSRYLLGVRFDPRALRLALVDAAAGMIGNVSDRLLLLCAHFAPLSGRHDAAVMNLVRLFAVLLALGLGGWTWRHRRAPVRRTTP